MKLPKTGLTFIVGNMFGGKTSRFGSILSHAAYSGKKVQAFKISWDDRYGETNIKTHDGAIFSKIPTRTVENTADLIRNLNSDVEVIGIDEVQFFDDKIFYFIINNLGKYHFVVTGLKLDFRGNPFPLRRSSKHEDSEITVGNLMPYATEIINVPSYCRQNGGENICGEVAVFIQRFKEDGSIASSSDPTVVVGASDIYSPRCEKHFVKPD